MKRNRGKNDGLRKVCGHPRRAWPKCPHPWHISLRHKGEDHRFSLARELPHRDTRTKLQAEAARDQIFAEIRGGTFRPRLAAAVMTGPARATLTVQQLFDRHEQGHVMKQRPDSLARWQVQKKAILRHVLTLPNGQRRPLGEWFVADVTLDTIEAFQELRTVKAKIGANRDLGALRAVFAFGVKRGLLDGTPFKRAGIPTLSKNTERKRTRRLQPGEAEKILAACPVTTGPQRGPHQLRAMIEFGLETGARHGEIVSLQWNQVRLDGPRPAIVLPASKTKTKRDREIPISTRLRAILEMRQTDPDGEKHPATAYVFGNAAGEQVHGLAGSWERVRLRAHGIEPQYKKGTGKLTPESREALRKIDLHFHDLRREAGSRWLDAGVPLHTIQRWLGHTNISQTSTYLAVTDTGSHDAMVRFDAQRATVAAPEARPEARPDPHATPQPNEASLQFANLRTKRGDKAPRDRMALHTNPRKTSANRSTSPDRLDF